MNFWRNLWTNTWINSWRTWWKKIHTEKRAVIGLCMMIIPEKNIVKIILEKCLVGLWETNILSSTYKATIFYYCLISGMWFLFSRHFVANSYQETNFVDSKFSLVDYNTCVLFKCSEICSFIQRIGLLLVKNPIF